MTGVALGTPEASIGSVVFNASSAYSVPIALLQEQTMLLLALFAD